MTPNKAMSRTLDRDLLSLPLQSAVLKRRVSRRHTALDAPLLQIAPGQDCGRLHRARRVWCWQQAVIQRSEGSLKSIPEDAGYSIEQAKTRNPGLSSM